MHEKERTRDYTMEDIADMLDMTPYSIRNALWRYRCQGFAESDYLAGLTSVPPAYRAGRSLRWPVAKFEQWKSARMTFDLQPFTRQKEIREIARERAKPGSGVRRRAGRKRTSPKLDDAGSPT